MQKIIVVSAILGCILAVIDQMLYNSANITEMSFVGKVGVGLVILTLVSYPVVLIIGLFKK